MAQPEPAHKPEVRPDPLFFLPASYESYRDDIAAQLKKYPPEHKSLDLAAQRLLKPHYRFGAPGDTCRSRVSKWLRTGHSHEMILAALVICGQKADVSTPFQLIEKHLLLKFKPGKGPAPGTRPPARVTQMHKIDLDPQPTPPPGQPHEPTDWDKVLPPRPVKERRKETDDEKEKRLARRHGFDSVEAYRAYKKYRDQPTDDDDTHT